jgi:Flp pilus assembly protein TadG
MAVRSTPVKKWGVLRRLLRNRSGAAALEFAIVAPVFLALIMSTFEVGWFYFVNSSLDTAVTNAAREIRTGQAYKSGYTAQSMRDQFLQQEVCKNLRFMSASKCASTVTVEARTFATYQALAADTAGFTCTDDLPAARQAVPFQTGTDRSIIRIRLCMIYQTLNPMIGVSLARGKSGAERRVTASYVLRVEPDASK